MRATRCLDAGAIRPCLQFPEGAQMLLGIAYELVIQETPKEGKSLEIRRVKHGGRSRT